MLMGLQSQATNLILKEKLSKETGRVGGVYYKMIWFDQLNWSYELFTKRVSKTDVSSASPLSERVLC